MEKIKRMTTFMNKTELKKLVNNLKASGIPEKYELFIIRFNMFKNNSSV